MFSDVFNICQINQMINHDISKTGLNFLSDSSAYRMVALQKQASQTHPWLIIAYANMNPLVQTTPEVTKTGRT